MPVQDKKDHFFTLPASGEPASSSWLHRLFSRENLWALLLGLIVIGLIILTAESQPVWIYQGF